MNDLGLSAISVGTMSIFVYITTQLLIQGEEQQLLQEKQATLDQLVDDIKRHIDKFVVNDPGYTLKSDMTSCILNSTDIVLIGSAGISEPLEPFKATTLEELGGKALFPESGESNIPIFFGDNHDKEKAKEIWQSPDKFVLCINEQTVRLPNKGNYVTLNTDDALLVLEKALGNAREI